MPFKTEKFINNNIHYIRETFDSGAINIYVDPYFQDPIPLLSIPPLPDLSTTTKKLDFIINELQLKTRFFQ